MYHNSLENIYNNAQSILPLLFPMCDFYQYLYSFLEKFSAHQVKIEVKFVYQVHAISCNAEVSQCVYSYMEERVFPYC